MGNRLNPQVARSVPAKTSCSYGWGGPGSRLPFRWRLGLHLAAQDGS